MSKSIKTAEIYEKEIDGIEYRITVPMNLDKMTVQRNTDCITIPKNSEIWNMIYKELDRL